MWLGYMSGLSDLETLATINKAGVADNGGMVFSKDFPLNDSEDIQTQMDRLANEWWGANIPDVYKQ